MLRDVFLITVDILCCISHQKSLGPMYNKVLTNAAIKRAVLTTLPRSRKEPSCWWLCTQNLPRVHPNAQALYQGEQCPAQLRCWRRNSGVMAGAAKQQFVMAGLPWLLPHLHLGHHLSHAKKQCCGIPVPQYRQKPQSK